MRAPPPVQVACIAGRGWRVAHLLLYAVSSAGAVACMAGWAELAPGAIAVCTWSGITIGGWLGWRLGATGSRMLAWDGEQWTLDGARGVPEVMIDLGGWLLLRFHEADPSGVHWVAVSARHAGPGFGLWRAALYSFVAQPNPASR